MPPIHCRTLVVAIASLAALVAGCTSWQTTPVASPSTTLLARTCPGGTGNPDPDLPIICVSKVGNTLQIDPPSIEVHNTDAADPAKGTPVVIQWVRKSGTEDLRIEMKDPNQKCLTDLVCRSGRCRAKSVKTAPNDPAAPHPGDPLRRCEYNVFLGEDEIDPEVVIIECCKS